MTDSKKVIAAAIDLLHELDVDPRHPTLTKLEGLLQDGPDIAQDAVLNLTAVIKQGGIYEVTDQFGRQINGVHSVAVFKDQHGRDVMQINL